MRLRRRKPMLVKHPRSYTEMRSHRSGAVTGYIPDEVFDAITGRVSRGMYWIRREDVDALHAHPQFVSVADWVPAPQTEDARSEGV